VSLSKTTKGYRDPPAFAGMSVDKKGKREGGGGGEKKKKPSRNNRIVGSRQRGVGKSTAVMTKLSDLDLGLETQSLGPTSLGKQ